MSTDLFGSSDDLSLFDDKPQVVTIDPNKDYLEELVGDGKKFKTPQDLAKGKAESDAFIANLLREQAELRNELTKAKTVEDLFQRMQDRGTNDSQSQGSQTNANQGNDSNSNVSFEEITKKIREELQREEENKRRAANLQEAQAKVLEVLGPQATSHIKTKAAELGVSISYLQELASKSPALFYSALALDKAKPSVSPFPTSPAQKVNPTGLQNVQGGERTMSYYQNLKKTDKAKYLSKEVQQQMMADAKRIGEAFFDI